MTLMVLAEAASVSDTTGAVVTVVSAGLAVASIGAAAGEVARSRRNRNRAIIRRAEEAARRAHLNAKTAASNADELDDLNLATSSTTATTQVAISASRIEAEVSSLADQQAQIYLAHLESSMRQNERLRLTALIVGVIGVLAILTGFGFALFGTASLGIFTGGCGALTSGVATLIFGQANAAEKAANDHFAHLNNAVTEAEQIRRALNIVFQISDEKKRDELLTAIALRQVFRDTAPADRLLQGITLPNQLPPA